MIAELSLWIRHEKFIRSVSCVLEDVSAVSCGKVLQIQPTAGRGLVGGPFFF